MPISSSTNVRNQQRQPRRKPGRCVMAFTVRLTELERVHFEALAASQGHETISAAFKAQALSLGMEHPLNEMRLTLDHLAARQVQESAGFQQQLNFVVNGVDTCTRQIAELRQETQACTQAMLLFAQSVEAMAHALQPRKAPLGSQTILSASLPSSPPPQ
ncbi:MAG: hypothetical protein IPG42_15675 [Betaproteobacteria bacterium]|nr:hypothetical protein [Betaproteobacteria bacterium]